MSQQGKFKKPKDLGNQTNYSPAPPDLGEELLFREGEARNRMPSESNSPWKGIVVNIIVALVIVFLMNSFVMPTVGKKQYVGDITRLENDLVAIRQVDASQNTKIDKVASDAQAIVNGKMDAIDKKIADANNGIDQKVAAVTGSLDNYATKSSLSDTNNRIDNTNNSLTSLANDLNNKISNFSSADINNLKVDMATLKVEIAGLKADIADIDNSNTSKEPDIELEPVGTGVFTENTPTGYTGGYVYETTLKLRVENNSDDDINITELHIYIYPTIGSGGVISQVQLTDQMGKTFWTSVDGKTPIFYNYKDIEINDNDTDTYTLKLTIVITGQNNGISSYESDIELEDWEEN